MLNSREAGKPGCREVRKKTPPSFPASKPLVSELEPINPNPDKPELKIEDLLMSLLACVASFAKYGSQFCEVCSLRPF